MPAGPVRGQARWQARRGRQIDVQAWYSCCVQQGRTLVVELARHSGRCHAGLPGSLTTSLGRYAPQRNRMLALSLWDVGGPEHLHAEWILGSSRQAPGAVAPPGGFSQGRGEVGHDQDPAAGGRIHFCFSRAFQSIGLGLVTAIGAALAQPDRLPAAALGDGGALMAAAELETVRRLALPMVVVIYDDAAYGAEVHHFGPDGHPLGTVTFPETDIASIGRGYGFEAITVRSVADLGPVPTWLAGPRSAPLLKDAKVTRDRGPWWLEEALRGH